MASTKEFTHTLKEVKQIFFDCDNTLVGTEDVAAEAASVVINKVLVDQKIYSGYDNLELFTEHFGKTARQMIVVLQDKYNFTLTKEQIAAYTKYEEDLVIDLLHQNPIPCRGVKEILHQLSDMKKYKLAVVSSSPIRRIRAALESADLVQFFDYDNVFSAKSSMPTPKSKPDPAIYQFAMEKMGVTPEQCVAFEDSRSGARSAIDAGVFCVAYVGAYELEETKNQVAETLRGEGCKLVMKNYSELDGCLKEIRREMEN